MLTTSSKTGKDSFSIKFDDLDDNSLCELSSDEASEITGGFTASNDTNATRVFYNFGPNDVPERQALQPGEIADFDGSYILYNSSRTRFVPALSGRLDPDDFASFRQEGNRIVLSTGDAGGGVLSIQRAS
ncbi:hypothetical protein [Nostoc sp. UHCC 0251]|uniref:hypothetical protein n=1 Tax=Nostoc sp. UHCC 0251 TaxID=3110240 RepID=UPI002B1F32EC|nr:hypothetical protein [Nostoc sp. UHCC 0251]MEA5624713.1 hypothetical protein [Nostoc sp. UHCC 0251]